ncbi:sigma-54 dependent transcriptional regulator [Candidatus Berkiella cookevillensis]|uniref:Nitrogen assimilation regulatory protein n=1 Tax=Candidatus Berkiella cookevillensis TaxID=437022 RepID=A0A0Q9YGT2_9GAMM|nr:sigma-54 dependent transcriptional regulator [Candidatus Berkiella cookevillensis]MCS5708614.1 sigma-54 dependent transcriptional regulator [Candidatus Berkiella cookevillensis]
MESYTVQELSGNSSQILEIKAMIQKVAHTEVNVFITGESGTGKEIAARCLHMMSNRRNKPFIPVNCGAIPHELLESELFGHEKGAFTGAISTRKGRFELADGGTIFLDEIGDMPLNMQVKILRVIQERVFERIGSNQSLKSNVRIIAATHRNLEDGIKQGVFREDLFYRLNVFPIEMPSLRSRKEDVPIIINHLISRLSKELKSEISLTSQCISHLQNCEWKGNIRELSNLIERLFVLYPNQTIDAGQLPEKYRGQGIKKELGNVAEVTQSKIEQLSQTILVSPASVKTDDSIDLKEVLNNIEKAYIMDALNKSNGVVAHAAKLLKIRRTTLVEKIRKYHLLKDQAA